MRMVRSFALVVIHLIGELWIGLGRNPDFYDRHTSIRTRSGYALFVALAAILAVGIVTWGYIRLR